MDDPSDCAHTRAACVETSLSTRTIEPDVLDRLDDAWRKHAREVLDRCTAWSGGRGDDGREAFSRAWSRAAANLITHRPELIDTRAWLLTLAYRACMDLHRERSRRGEQELDVTRPVASGASPHFSVLPIDPERLALGKELSSFLLGAVQQLPARLREAMLTYMSSGSYHELVERFGITDANARKRIQQARAILRERLGDYRRGRGRT
ncbi:MAG: polymerase, sigma-24 subunit, subfamily [Acidobacteria bacterium]|nr:polymerase, sigma-24 subunit, subfamily [Acidobacteriota bacterium]